MIVADLIEWLQKQPPTDTVFLRWNATIDVHLVCDSHHMTTSATRVYDEAAAKRYASRTAAQVSG